MDTPLKVDVAEMLGLQMAEVEMLASMFPNDGEFEIDDPGCIAEIQGFLDGEVPYDALQARLGFTVKLEVDVEKGDKVFLELVCFMPHEYPNALPDLFIRSSSLGKNKHQDMIGDIKSYLNDLDRGEICVGPVIEWIKENAHNYLSSEEVTAKTNVVKKHDNKFTRMWIYSHHLYSKIKRRDIIDFSAELKLTGFSMPGKPGMIVIEGYSDFVEEFWRRIRNMQWKKITMKEKEDCDIEEGKTVDDYRRFDSFEEKGFDAKPGRGRAVHMDLGMLYQFLEERKCGAIFHLFFGVDGKQADED